MPKGGASVFHGMMGVPDGVGCHGKMAAAENGGASPFYAIGWFIRSFSASLMDGWVKMKSRRKV